MQSMSSVEILVSKRPQAKWHDGDNGRRQLGLMMFDLLRKNASVSKRRGGRPYPNERKQEVQIERSVAQNVVFLSTSLIYSIYFYRHFLFSLSIVSDFNRPSLSQKLLIKQIKEF